MHKGQKGNNEKKEKEEEERGGGSLMMISSEWTLPVKSSRSFTAYYLHFAISTPFSCSNNSTMFTLSTYSLLYLQQPK